METRAHYVAVGAFVVTIVFLAFGAVLWLGRVELSQDFAKYYIFFRGSVAGLSKGSTVQYKGIPVGRVIDIRVDPDNVEQIQVTVEIDQSLVVIKSDARAYLDTNILSGVSTIQIRGGTTEAADLTPEGGHKYPVIEAGQSELERVKASLPELLGSLKDAAHSLDTLLNAQNREAITETIANIRTVTAAAADQSRVVSQVVTNANASILQLTGLLHDLEESYSARGGLKDQASQTLADYDRVAKNLTETTRQIQLVIQENRQGVRRFHAAHPARCRRSGERGAAACRECDAVGVRNRARPDAAVVRRTARGLSAAMTGPTAVLPRRLLLAVGLLGLSGCPRWLVSPPPAHLYRLTPKSTFPPNLPRVTAQLLVDMPIAPAGLDTTRITLSRSPVSLDYFADSEWTDRVPPMVKSALVLSFAKSGAIVAIDRESIGLRADFLLKPEIRHFEAEYASGDTPPKIWVAIDVKLVKMPERVIIAQASFERQVAAAANDLPVIVAAFDEALGGVMKEIVLWTLANPALLRSRPQL